MEPKPSTSAETPKSSLLKKLKNFTKSPTTKRDDSEKTLRCDVLKLTNLKMNKEIELITAQIQYYNLRSLQIQHELGIVETNVVVVGDGGLDDDKLEM